jgi:hypothetical protein
MPGKIFVNYRRDDAAGDARGVRDGLAAKFGESNVFMDVDNLRAGQRFDLELAKALDACDVFVAIVGPRWLDLLRQRDIDREYDYVREEIAAALLRGINIIPVRVGHEGNMPRLPQPNELPEDLQAFVLHQKHDVVHERFRRDIADLIQAVEVLRKSKMRARAEQPGRRTGWRLKTTVAVMFIAIVASFAGYALVYLLDQYQERSVSTDETLERRGSHAPTPVTKAAIPDGVEHLLCKSPDARTYGLELVYGTTGDVSEIRANDGRYQVTKMTSATYEAEELNPSAPDAGGSLFLDRITGKLTITNRISGAAVDLLAKVCDNRLSEEVCEEAMWKIKGGSAIECLDVTAVTSAGSRCAYWQKKSSNVLATFVYTCQPTEKKF